MKPTLGLSAVPGTLDTIYGEDASMSRSGKSDEERSESRKRRRRRPRDHGRSRGRGRSRNQEPSEPEAPEPVEELSQLDESLLAPEERAYLEARRRAEHKVELYRELVKAGVIALPLLFLFGPWAAGIVVLIASVRLGRRVYGVFLEPQVRERIVRDEVAKQVHFSVHRERAQLEGEHARSLEELSASIAHEIRNPITAAKSLVQQMGEEPDASENLEYARVAVGELERVERSISHLLRFARDEELRMSVVKMADVLESALETFRDRASRSKVEIVRHFDCEGAMRGDAEKLRRIVINLVGNAIDALEESQTENPSIEVSMGENLAGTEVWLRIRDNGNGIDSETLDKMFSPFFTSKQSGTGLGLAITKKLVEAHAGTIEVASTPGAGAEFVLGFPKRAGNGGATQAGAEPAGARS
jgi:signal transduction histidine kinase